MPSGSPCPESYAFLSSILIHHQFLEGPDRWDLIGLGLGQLRKPGRYQGFQAIHIALLWLAGLFCSYMITFRFDDLVYASLERIKSVSVPLEERPRL